MQRLQHWIFQLIYAFSGYWHWIDGIIYNVYYTYSASIGTQAKLAPTISMSLTKLFLLIFVWFATQDYGVLRNYYTDFYSDNYWQCDPYAGICNTVLLVKLSFFIEWSFWIFKVNRIVIVSWLAPVHAIVLFCSISPAVRHTLTVVANFESCVALPAMVSVATTTDSCWMSGKFKLTNWPDSDHISNDEIQTDNRLAQNYAFWFFSC